MTHKDNQRTRAQPEDDEANHASSILATESVRTSVGPTTDHASRQVMLRAERRDSIVITEIEQRFDSSSIPSKYTVVQRTETYFGPELLLAADDRNFLLTAPGPDAHLLLWSEHVNEREYRTNWDRSAEVRASIDETPQYELCDQCGKPLRSEEHERLSLLGRCLDGS